MAESLRVNVPPKRKGWFSRWLEKLDKQMEKTAASSCCGKAEEPGEPKKSSCC